MPSALSVVRWRFLSPSVFFRCVITLCRVPVQSWLRRCTVNVGQVILLKDVGLGEGCSRELSSCADPVC